MTRDRTRRPVRGWLAATVVASALFLLPLPQPYVESLYARSAFRWWQPHVTAITNLAPFAWIDVLILLAAALVLGRVVRLARTVRETGWASAMWDALRRALRATATLAIVFLLMWGLNYRRVPLDATLPPASPAVPELREVVVQAAALAARVRPHEWPPDARLASNLQPAFNAALSDLGFAPLRVAGRPKHSRLLTPFFTAAGVDGMVNPFALETIVHPDLLPFERGVTLAHEWAHLAGRADEAEASAVGWLACLNGGPDLVYSAVLYLIVEGAHALPRGVWREVAGQLDPGIRADLDAMARRQERQRPAVRTTAFRAYDQYLKANRVEDGLASYSRALMLILSPALRARISGYRADPDRRP